jgi:hypothetical protein
LEPQYSEKEADILTVAPSGSDKSRENRWMTFTNGYFPNFIYGHFLNDHLRFPIAKTVG